MNHGHVVVTAAALVRSQDTLDVVIPLELFVEPFRELAVLAVAVVYALLHRINNLTNCTHGIGLSRCSFLCFKNSNEGCSILDLNESLLVP